VVPDLDRPRAVLAGRDLAGEGGVGERVVFHVDGEGPGAGLERHSLRDGPGRQSAVALEPEVVVKPAGVVALDDEDRLVPPPAAASGAVWAPPGGSGTTASITPRSRQWPASSRKAAAAFFASPASRQRIAAHPSGEITA